MTDEERLSLQRIRGQLARFTPERPMFVPPTLYYELEQHPELADMLDRVRPNAPIPLDDPRPPAL